MIFVVMRGLSGSGKSTLAAKIGAAIGGRILSTDDKFMVGGVYKFDPRKLAAYHDATFAEATRCFDAGVPVVLDNTNTQRWHYDRYVKRAHAKGYQVVQAVVYDGGCSDEQLAARNTHGVPLAGIRSQRASWRDDHTLPDVRGMFDGREQGES